MVRSSSDDWRSWVSSDQSSLESVKVFGSCGSGTKLVSQSIAANSSSRPRRTCSPSSGSGCEVKNCQGVVAPHSSPMKIIGENGLSRVTIAARPCWSAPILSASRSPVARLPIWSWLSEQTTSRQVGVRYVSIGCPCDRCRKLDRVPVWKNPSVNTLPSASSESKSA